MKDYTKSLPSHKERYVGENDLFLEIYEQNSSTTKAKKPPLLFVHGAYTGSWMWSKYIPHFIEDGWNCYVMNMRSHYKSRCMDMTRIRFEDYLQDISEMIHECGEAPVLIGFSMGGILCQKLAETALIAGLVLIDSSCSSEVNETVPFSYPDKFAEEIVVPAPAREEHVSMDESEDDIAFQKKYLSMESSLAFREFSCLLGSGKGISIDGSLIDCPSLVIKAVNSDDDDRRGIATANQLHAEYVAFHGATHTGLLVGQKYTQGVERTLKWLQHNFM